MFEFLKLKHSLSVDGLKNRQEAILASASLLKARAVECIGQKNSAAVALTRRQETSLPLGDAAINLEGALHTLLTQCLRSAETVDLNYSWFNEASKASNEDLRMKHARIGFIRALTTACGVVAEAVDIALESGELLPQLGQDDSAEKMHGAMDNMREALKRLA